MANSSADGYKRHYSPAQCDSCGSILQIRGDCQHHRRLLRLRVLHHLSHPCLYVDSYSCGLQSRQEWRGPLGLELFRQSRADTVRVSGSGGLQALLSCPDSCLGIKFGRSSLDDPDIRLVVVGISTPEA